MLLSKKSFSIIDLNDHQEFGSNAYYSRETAIEIIDNAA